MCEVFAPALRHRQKPDEPGCDEIRKLRYRPPDSAMHGCALDEEVIHPRSAARRAYAATCHAEAPLVCGCTKHERERIVL